MKPKCFHVRLDCVNTTSSSRLTDELFALCMGNEDNKRDYLALLFWLLIVKFVTEKCVPCLLSMYLQ